MAELIKGALVANHIRQEVRQEVARLRSAGVCPRLAVCLVGDDPGSAIYVRRKEQACAAVDIDSVRAQLPADATTADVLAVLRDWNADPAVHGILVQLPLPEQVDRFAVLAALDPAKDVDAITPTSYGMLVHGQPRFLPCTPAGIVELFKYHEIPLQGQHVVIVNSSLIVGQPLALMLVQDHALGRATVTVCHQYTRDIGSITSTADILVVAVGRRPVFTVRAPMVKDGAIVIDAGINRIDGRVVGDVAFEEVFHKAALITPVPGGVGPCTIALLLKNTVTAARLGGKGLGLGSPAAHAPQINQSSPPIASAPRPPAGEGGPAGAG